jgi:two-component system response regulator TctD
VRILIVEDDAAMARGLAERLKLSGFAVDIESDGASAAGSISAPTIFSQAL